MKITGITPNISLPEGADSGFYTGYLGLTPQYDAGWVVNLCAPDNPAVDLQLITCDETAPVDAALSMHVDDVDKAYAQAISRGYEIVHPLTDESWGVRRFFVRAPDGTVVNLVAHR